MNVKKLATRVIEGIGEGVTFPAATSFWGKWAHPNERASLAAFSFSGAQFGTIISMPISGIICKASFQLQEQILKFPENHFKRLYLVFKNCLRHSGGQVCFIFLEV